jgi:long-subunit acyl-CoA synthetase (AMP-forming)
VAEFPAGCQVTGLPGERQMRMGTRVLIAARAGIYSHSMAGVDQTEQNGCLTPTLKVKRALIHKEFAAEIEELYR